MKLGDEHTIRYGTDGIDRAAYLTVVALASLGCVLSRGEEPISVEMTPAGLQRLIAERWSAGGRPLSPDDVDELGSRMSTVVGVSQLIVARLARASTDPAVTQSLQSAALSLSEANRALMRVG